MTRERYACVSNERWTREVPSSDGSKTYRVSYEQVFVRGRDEIVWRFTCECKATSCTADRASTSSRSCHSIVAGKKMTGKPRWSTMTRRAEKVSARFVAPAQHHFQR